MQVQWKGYHEVVGTLKPYLIQKNLFEYFALGQTAAPKLSLTISIILDGSQFFMNQQLKQYVFFKYGIVLCLQKRVSLFFYFYIHEKVVIK